MIYAGQGVHFSQAWDRLRVLAELLEAPVVTSLSGKSAFPETHPLSAGSGGRSIPKTVFHSLQNADLIFGIGCSFTTSNFATPMPKGKTVIHATLDPTDLNKHVIAQHALIGDAGLTLDLLVAEVTRPGARDAPRPRCSRRGGDPDRRGGVAGGVEAKAHVEGCAPVPVPGDLGPAAHGRRREHRHHSRRR